MLSRRTLLASAAAVPAVSLVAQPAHAAASRITVVSLNYPGRYSGRADTLDDLARRFDVDAFLLQEVGDGVPKRDKPAGFGHWRPKRARSSAVLWRRSTMRARERGAWRVHADTQPRYVVWTRFLLASGSDVTLGGVHLIAFRHRKQLRAAQARRASLWLEGSRARLLAGDTNDAPTARTLAPLRRVADEWATAPTFGRAKLDTAWARGLRILEAFDVPTRSDHDALVLRLSVPQT